MLGRGLPSSRPSCDRIVKDGHPTWHLLPIQGRHTLEQMRKIYGVELTMTTRPDEHDTTPEAPVL